MLAALLPIAVLASSVSAARISPVLRAAPTEPIVQWDYPPNRGWHASTLSSGPCGGFDIGGRVDFPMNGGQFALEQTRDAHQIQISYSTLADPTKVSDFTPLGANLTRTFSGSSCLPAPDFSTIGLSAGQSMTLKLEFTTGPKNTTHYSCADINLVDTASYIKPTYECLNVTESTRTKSDEASNSQVAAAKSKKTLSSADAGGIGAGVTLGVVALVLAALWYSGFAAFGKKAIEKRKWEADAHVMGDRKSITKSVGSTNY